MFRLETVVKERETALRLLQTGQEKGRPGAWRRNIFGYAYWWEQILLFAISNIYMEKCNTIYSHFKGSLWSYWSVALLSSFSMGPYFVFFNRHSYKDKIEPRSFKISAKAIVFKWANYRGCSLQIFFKILLKFPRIVMLDSLGSCCRGFRGRHFLPNSVQTEEMETVIKSLVMAVYVSGSIRFQQSKDL